MSHFDSGVGQPDVFVDHPGKGRQRQVPARARQRKACFPQLGPVQTLPTAPVNVGVGEDHERRPCLVTRSASPETVSSK
jgi:hypothetical protein